MFHISGFLQIPPRDEHPCLRLYPSHYRADSRLAPVRNVRRRAHSKKAPALKLKRRCFRVHRLLPLIGFHQQGEPYCSPIGLSFPTCIFTLFCCTIHVICFLNVLLHYERNSILLGKGFNIAVCRTVDGEVVATVKIFFVINTG